MCKLLGSIKVIKDYGWNDPVYSSKASIISLLIRALVESKKKINRDFEAGSGRDTGT